MKLSYNELSEITGMTYRTIKKRIDGLDPVCQSSTRANLWESTEALPLIYGIGRDDGGKLDGPEEKARLDKARRICQELKNKKIEGELLPVAEILDQWQRIAAAIRTQFLALPSRLSQMLETVTTPRERHQMIESEVKTILNMLADMGEAGEV